MRRGAGGAPRFVADAMLGALARWLRVLGLDTAYDPGLDDAEIVAQSMAEDRTILTRDRRLVERRLAANHLLIESEVIDEQVRQVLAACALAPDPERLFLRCLRCNEELVPADAEEAQAQVPPYVTRTQQEFRRCPACGRFYWRASHVQRMRDRLRRMEVG